MSPLFSLSLSLTHTRARAHTHANLTSAIMTSELLEIMSEQNVSLYGQGGYSSPTCKKALYNDPSIPSKKF